LSTYWVSQSRKNRGCLSLISNMENQFSAVSAVLKKLPKKSPIMNYEQLLSSVFSCFHGLKIIFCFFWKWLSVRTKKLLNIKKKLKKIWIFFWFFFFVIFYRLPADLNSGGKSKETPRQHLSFLICAWYIPGSRIYLSTIVHLRKNLKKYIKWFFYRFVDEFTILFSIN
jgi:hypothetical protein